MARSMMTRAVMVALLVLGTTGARAQTADYSDIWWNPAESGWGVTFTQNNDFIFMTFFVYGSGGQPTWYTAQTTRAGNGDFSGPVYATSGPFFGGPFDPASVSIRTAGFATFHPYDSFEGSLTYTADGYGHTSYIQRQTLTAILVGGTYQTVFTGTQSGCADPGNNRSFVETDQVVASQTFSPNTIRLDFYRNGSFACRMEGGYIQTGRTLRLDNASYTCTTGLSTSVNLSDVLVTPIGLEGSWSAGTLNGCQEAARFAGVLQ